ncbi:hypothetical protein HanXRQr2_Chr15g0701121 [Helianthus annuus]|uniref:Uncharacterized protein n=1 Tax=Helianthus annuus TaxID=4232 RepID=A0A9K3E1X0_HELAN|nr:hypothetical protein HanXRQr2_Chr15g0701121 [Helianthus annuus]KAJ0653038.1 hypothetical protein HanOQP8_Chr15g0578991 [Helianthus annuus]KAJ0831924.1 hypothetical protein HanPSC8_Chr15g0672791 [Helianthus annuus]
MLHFSGANFTFIKTGFIYIYLLIRSIIDKTQRQERTEKDHGYKHGNTIYKIINLLMRLNIP